MTIKIYQTVLAGTHTPNDSCKWRAECEVDGRMFETTSRRGASEKLCRELVKAGIPDERVEVYSTSMPERRLYTFRSMHAAAGFTYGESAKTPLRRGKFVDISTRISAPT